ncbi:unnamed protein product, partial [marine sediment metagenome]
MTAPITIDYETGSIEDRPAYPPKPVGVGIYEPGKKPHYYAFGHPSGNNCTRDGAIRVLNKARRSGRPLLFHGSKFDCAVADEHLGIPYPAYTHTYDTLIEAFLVDPNARAVSLKPLAEKELGMPPEEQIELRDWVWANVPKTKGKKKTWAAHICKAPGGLVGMYCVGDIVRTRKLHDLYMPQIRAAGMLNAYERELKLSPILHQMEKAGIPVATRRLARDVPKFERMLELVDTWVGRHLGVKDLDVDKG